MASQSNPAGTGGGDLDARIARLEQKFDRIQQATASLKTTNRLLTLVLVVVIVGAAYMAIFQPFKTLYDNRTALLKDLQARAQKEVMPKLMEEGRKLISDDLQKDLVAKLESTIEKEVPKLQSLAEKELNLLVDNLDSSIRSQFADRGMKFQDKYVALFKKEFPDIDLDRDAEAMFKNLDAALNNVGERLMERYLAQHRQAVQDIALTFDKITLPEHIVAMSNDGLLEHSIGILTDIVAMKFDLASEFDIHGSGSAAAAGK